MTMSDVSEATPPDEPAPKVFMLRGPSDFWHYRALGLGSSLTVIALDRFTGELTLKLDADPAA
jgi:hypothetical protein